MAEELFTRKQMENAVMLAADLYQQMYNSPETDGGALEVSGTIIEEAVKMEAWLVGKYGEDDEEYLDRLEEYEAMIVQKYDLRLPEVTELEEMEFYSIESDGKGGKQIHMLGYIYQNDDHWTGVEPAFLILPLQEFIDQLAKEEDYTDRLLSEAKLYEGDYDDEGAVDYINHYFDGHTANRRLHYSEITIDTPCGDYIA